MQPLEINLTQKVVGSENPLAGPTRSARGFYGKALQGPTTNLQVVQTFFLEQGASPYVAENITILVPKVPTWDPPFWTLLTQAALTLGALGHDTIRPIFNTLSPPNVKHVPHSIPLCLGSGKVYFISRQGACVQCLSIMMKDLYALLKDLGGTSRNLNRLACIWHVAGKLEIPEPLKDPNHGKPNNPFISPV